MSLVIRKLVVVEIVRFALPVGFITSIPPSYIVILTLYDPKCKSYQSFSELAIISMIRYMKHNLQQD
jgi:hypothetical protein